MVCEHYLDLFKKFLPPGIYALRARQTVEMASLDLVDQLGRITAREDQIETSPGNHQGIRQSKDAISDGVPVMMVVKQPAVYIALAQGGLNSGKGHEKTSILNNCRVLNDIAETHFNILDYDLDP